jgi:hypothetical protein
LANVKKIYLNSDGGGWIKAAGNRLGPVVKVLDGSHLNQHLLKMARHMGGSAWDAMGELRAAIKDGCKGDFSALAEKLLGCAENDPDRARIEEGRDYVMNNWSPAKARLHSRGKARGCSAEGHVSHVLSGRMSSRPMGWSVRGADRMARLRAYFWNKGDMLELVRYQKKGLPLAAGGEGDVLSAADVLMSERPKKEGVLDRELAKYAECMRASVPPQIKKKAAFNAHIWDL